MLFVLETLEYQIPLFIFEFFYFVFCAHVIETSKIKIRFILIIPSVLLKHVCTEVKNCFLVNIKIFIIEFFRLTWVIFQL